MMNNTSISYEIRIDEIIIQYGTTYFLFSFKSRYSKIDQFYGGTFVNSLMWRALPYDVWIKLKRSWFEKGLTVFLRTSKSNLFQRRGVILTPQVKSAFFNVTGSFYTLFHSKLNFQKLLFSALFQKIPVWTTFVWFFIVCNPTVVSPL